MTADIKLRECFKLAKHDEEKGKKHKGLILIKPDDNEAKDYLKKAKDHLEVCSFFKQTGRDYRLPEEWFYCMYLCGLAIITKFGVESRSQRCTALFLRHVKELGLIEIEDEFIHRITVYSEKDKRTDVDERQDSKYSAWMKNQDVIGKYEYMMNFCRKCIEQCSEIVYSKEEFKLSKELFDESNE